VRILIDYRPALRSRSGAGEYTHELAAALLALGAPARAADAPAVTLFSSSWKDRLRLEPELRGAAALDMRIPVALLNLCWHRFGWPPVERMVRLDYDVTHSSHPLIMPARKAARVVTIHDLDFLKHPERTRAEIRRDYPALVRRHARAADGILVPSMFTRHEVERVLDVPGERITVCSPGAPDWSPRARPTGRNAYILFLGTLEPRKNVGTLLDAYERLLAATDSGSDPTAQPVPPLVLAGRHTPGAAVWLDRIARAPLAGHVKAIGYVDPVARRALYEGASALVIPSLDEGFGLPALEAMTVGVPVVAANRGAIPEVLGGAGVLVDPLDAGAIASGLRRIIDDEAFASACVGKGLARAGTYRWSDTAARACEAYRQAIAHRASARRVQ
jgi:glycosyltransferase involved in cell wall biosynthesis